MDKTMRHEVIHHTLDGDVRIRSMCTIEEIQAFRFGRFGAFAHYRSLYTKRESLEAKADESGSNVVIAIDEQDEIVGFGVLAFPDTQERWAYLSPTMMEVKAIEVAREWRRFNIAHRLVEGMMSLPEIEEKIVYFVGYAWTWDLDGERKSAVEYRRMMIRLFEPFEFVEYETNEPNISLKPENIFMARIGSAVPKPTVENFKWLRYGIVPDHG